MDRLFYALLGVLTSGIVVDRQLGFGFVAAWYCITVFQ